MSPIGRADTLLTDEAIQRETDAGHWPAPTVPEMFAKNARDCPDREAYADERERVTWGELHERATRVALGLLDMGIQPGDVVAIQIPNRIAYLIALVAISQTGAVVCPCDTSLRERELEFVLRFSGTVAVFVVADDPRYDHLAAVEALAPGLPALREVVAVGTTRGGTPARTLDSLLDRPVSEADRERLAERAPSAHDVCRLLFTSGSTGDPKGVLHTHAATTYGNFGETAHMGMDQDSVILVCIPAALNWGMFQLLQGAVARCRVVLLERFDPARVLDLAESESVTTTGVPPTALIALLEQPDVERRDLRSLQLITTAGAACPIELLRRAHARLCCVVIEAYGMTELGWISATDPAEPPEASVGTVGRPHPWVDVRILDDGEVVVGGPCVCVGYYRNPQRNAEAFLNDGSFRTGDVGQIGDDGRLRLVGQIGRAHV